MLAAVGHGAGNAWAGYLDSYRGNFFNMVAFGVVTVVVSAIVVIVAGPEHLSRKYERNVPELGEENV